MRRALMVSFVAVMVVAACGGSGTEAPEPVTVGFIFVGPRDDLGYNQAAWEGSEALERALPDLRVLRVENVPEDASAVTALEDLIDEGASILFATSYGHLAAAYEVADEHPRVTVLHQGGVEPEPRLDNLGTYFGTHSEALYLAGITAGSATRTNQLGFVVAFPIPATFNNVNAFALGARSVNPQVSTRVLFTSSWCDPGVQATAASELIAAGVDVIAQHQDCTGTILEAAEDAGLYSVGYHADGSEVAADGWLIGAVWRWDDIYVDMAKVILTGEFASSDYNDGFVGSFAGGDNPFVLTEPGPSVSTATRDMLDAARQELDRGTSPFAGPLIDRDGVTRVLPGESLGTADLDTMDWFVDGVLGDLPPSD